MILVLFLAIFNSVCITPVVRENIKVKLALAIVAGTPKTHVIKIILILPLVADKTIKVLSI